jgi:isochorismate pyruvate lyase
VERDVMMPPAQCQTMSDVRAAIDALDDQLVALLASRVGYVERAAALKPALGIPARAPDRVAQVLSRVEAQAAACGLPKDLADRLWRLMIDWAINHEHKLMNREAARS